MYTVLSPGVSSLNPDGPLNQPADGAVLWTARVGMSGVAIGGDDELREGMDIDVHRQRNIFNFLKLC